MIRPLTVGSNGANVESHYSAEESGEEEGAVRNGQHSAWKLEDDRKPAAENGGGPGTGAASAQTMASWAHKMSNVCCGCLAGRRVRGSRGFNCQERACNAESS